ncbi:MAG TPA: DUF2027 domain-containing protein [Bacteroidales bacterium]|nr:DUF2027 domain-containing protein [Bacteroidales bacterium]
MELKIGDKVRFMDAVGGGTITAFKGKDMVMVLEEDGFETPVLKRQCVVVETTPKPTSAKPTTSSIVDQPMVPKQIMAKQPETRAGEILNVSLAFLPAEGKSFQESQFECYLINESNYTLMFNYASCSGKTWTSRFAGSIEPNSKLFLEEFGREVINDLEKLSLQFLAYKPGTFYTFKNSYSVEIRLDTVKFYKVHCFRENDFFEEDALVVPVISNDNAEKSLLIEPEDIRRAMLDKMPEKPKGSQPLPPKNGPMEIDLHIESLLDTTAGMDHAAILNHQLEAFRKVMDENQKKKGVKIVFIHGKGDGVLRSAIVKELLTKYKTCRYQDASFREYGFGATMVTMG